MAMVNVNNLLNIKDSRWLQLEVCREFQRNKCSRPDTECKFAHPPANVEVQNGRVTACYDSIKGRCNREKPPCKYFHPPAHLKDQLLINGRNHLALKNALMQQMGLAPGQPVVGPGQVPGVAQNPYLTGVTNQYNPYFATGPLVSLVSDPNGAVMSPLGVPQQTVVQQKLQRTDRLESRFFVGSPYSSADLEILNGHQRYFSRGFGDKNPEGNNNWTTYPGMVTYKRPAGDKGVIYQPANSPSAAAYQHLMQLQQSQPFVPVSSNSIQHNIPASSSGSSNTVGLLTANLGQDHSGLMNGTLDSNLDNESSVNKVKSEIDEGSNEIHDNGNVLVGGKVTLNSNDLEDEAKESAIKRMRVNNVGNSGQVNLNSNASVSASAQSAAMAAQNNAAYVAAAQTYHNALAAMNYTGVSLQTNKTQQQVVAQQQIQPSHSYPQPVIPQSGHQHYQSQQNQQQQQLISQYQAMAAAFAGQQGGYQQQQHHLGGAQGVQQQQPNLNYNQASAAGFNQLAAAAAMNPYLAASLPQIAAAQRANLLATHQQSGNAMSAAAAYGNSSPYGSVQQAQAASAAFNPFGMQFGGPGGAAAALPFQQNQQQQALLAAYGQFARGPVPVSAASGTIPTQQLYMGNPAVAAAAAAAAAANGPMQPGIKRMRPA